MADTYETCVTYIAGETHAIFYSCDRKYVGRLRKLAAQHPEDVIITMDDPEFGLKAMVPKTWFREPRPPAKRGPMTDEQKAAAADRLRKAREEKQGALV